MEGWERWLLGGAAQRNAALVWEHLVPEPKAARQSMQSGGPWSSLASPRLAQTPC